MTETPYFLRSSIFSAILSSPFFPSACAWLVSVFFDPINNQNIPQQSRKMHAHRRPARIFQRHTPLGTFLIKKTTPRTHTQLLACLKEATLLRLAQHPSVVQYRCEYADKEKSYCLETEWLAGGTLEGKTIGGDWERLWVWIYQLACGLEYMHRRGIIHRDIKPENIGIDGQGNIKFLDFGSAILKWELQQEGFSLVGTPAYTAPEMIARQKYDEKVDIYALGICIFELVYGRRPFEGESVDEYWRQAIECEIVLGECPQDLGTLLKKMVAKDPSKRISARTLLNQPPIRRRFLLY